VIQNADLPDDSVIVCSPTTRDLRLFGNRRHLSEEQTSSVAKIIVGINQGKQLDSNALSSIVKDMQGTLVFACTEISLQAHNEQLSGVDTLQITIEKIVREL
jgi:aspartate/glutamate racemase